MQALRIRVAQVIDFGPTIAIIGTDLASKLGVVLHIDHRPLQSIEQTWKSAGLSERIKFEADSLVLRLDLDCAEGPDDGLALSSRAA